MYKNSIIMLLTLVSLDWPPFGVKTLAIDEDDKILPAITLDYKACHDLGDGIVVCL